MTEGENLFLTNLGIIVEFYPNVFTIQRNYEIENGRYWKREQRHAI